MKAVRITKDNQQMLASRYAQEDLEMFPIGYILVTVFGDNGQYRYEGVLTDENFDAQFVKVKEIENGFWEIKGKDEQENV